jgi:maltooligosyltrehalose trehalohydrolase
MTAEPAGYFAIHVPQADTGTRYRFRLADGSVCPDPASRWQPDGPHGPSEVVDPAAYAWHDADWKGVTLRGQVVYELHIGTFTPEGTFASATRELAELASLGITLVEVMPVAEFPGRFGWGYDGVSLYAPEQCYGNPDDFRRFVDEAHRHGLGVMLDVVYNHLGPDGNYTGNFARAYQSHHGTAWGESLNFDGDKSGPVREFFIVNAGYWIDEFHIDGLRLDAVEAIHDESPEHILTAITRQARQAAAGRSVLVVAENDTQQARLMRSPEQGGYGLDGAWNDDFHHAAQVAATGRKEYYYADYQGTPQELISTVRWGYLYQGQWSLRQKRSRGTPAFDVPAACFVNFLQNHDQVANSAHGLRLHALTSGGRYRALTALLLLAPGTPLLFQGQEFAASTPFLYFADHDQALSKLVAEGRWQFLRNFEGLAGANDGTCPPELCGQQAFERSKLDLSERQQHAEAYSLHRDLLRLRREDPVFALQRGDRVHGAVIGPEAFLLRYFGDEGDNRLLVVNLGPDFAWTPVTEPLAAPPDGADWRILWSSEDLRYGGGGGGVLDTHQWRVAGHAAVALEATAPGYA